MMAALLTGVLLGLSSGIAPGPLLALVVAQTLRHGAREGCKIALTPLLTDTPIILLTWLAASRLGELRPVLGLVTMAGGAFVLYLAWDSIRPVVADVRTPAEPPRSWLKGVLTNMLSPHPWLFWLTVGAATLARAMDDSWIAAAAFLFGFYLLLVGSKVVVALLVARSRNFLTGRPYRAVILVLALTLAIFAILLFREGLKQLAVIRAF